MKSLEWTATGNAIGEWTAVWITKADIGWISWCTLSEFIGEVMEEADFGARDRDKNMLFQKRRKEYAFPQKRRKQYDMASRETFLYLYGWFCQNILGHILEMGLFQIAIRSWLFIYSSLWLSEDLNPVHHMCMRRGVTEPGDCRLLRHLLAIICEWQDLEVLIWLMH